MDPATICPLCGGPNRCGVAQGKGTCWCFYTEMPESVLAQIPDDQRLRACVCEACAQGLPSGQDGTDAGSGVGAIAPPASADPQ